MECLKKSGRIANQSMDTMVQTQLLVELLNAYMLFLEKGNMDVSGRGLRSIYSWIRKT